LPRLATTAVAAPRRPRSGDGAVWRVDFEAACAALGCAVTRLALPAPPRPVAPVGATSARAHFRPRPVPISPGDPISAVLILVCPPLSTPGGGARPSAHC